MRANQSTDVIDLNLAFKLRNLFLNQRRNCLGDRVENVGVRVTP